MNDVPTSLVIFGASGDLTKRKLIPGLFQLYREKLLPDTTRIVGFARKEKSHEQFRADMSEALPQFARSQPADGSDELHNFVKLLYYQTGAYDDTGSFGQLKKLLDDMDEQQASSTTRANRLFYLATPPGAFAGIVAMLGKTGHVTAPQPDTAWTRVVIEKPFGRDLESARALNREILAVLDESQVYRIDHYLGKETVQNIMAFRFGNSIFEPLWNRRYIDHIQIAVAEQVGVEKRGSYYDRSGALRDMVQNHILQLLSLIAMEPPASFAPNAVRNEKVKVLSALRPISPQEITDYSVRGQYATGTIGGQNIADYLREPDVDPNSRTETYVALKLYVDNWRWAGVPFFVRTGKALAQRLTEITIEFRQPPLALFSHAPHAEHVSGDEMQPNQLSLRVQPNEGIRLHFGIKIPGPSMVLQPTDMEFCYAEEFETQTPEAYERLILDAILGDSTLFIRADEVDAAWTWVDAILQAWESDKSSHIYPYRAGGWGPFAADEFMEKHHKAWTKF